MASDAGVPDGLNNFTSSNVAGLKKLLYEGVSIPSDSEAAQLIGFIRGTDSYDEDIDLQVGDQRKWKLGDIYHSEMTIVGPPAAINTKQAGNPKSEEYYKTINNYQEFFEANASRPTVVYVGANDGMLHAFEDHTGEELWGFVPPNILPALRQMTTSVPNTTIPIYGVDGSPAVKDIYYEGHWRTIVITGLGRDGYGYFALDITNPLNPKFLFALSNDPVNRVVRHWGPTGNLTENNYGSIPGEFEYSRLGQAWSTPTINLVSEAASPKWLAIIGGGFNGSESQEYGSAAYLIELDTAGRRRSRLDLPDTKGGFINSVPAQFTAVTPDTTPKATYQGAISYVVDMESKLFKFNFTDNGKPYAYDLIFDGEGNNVNQRASFMPVTATTDGGEDSDKKVWLYFGTGNQDKLELSQSTIQNRIFGIKDMKLNKFGHGMGKLTISNLKNVTDKAASCPKEDDLGWYVNLGKDEKVTNKIQISDKVLFAPLYTPDVSEGCFPGTSALAELGYGCGKVLRRTELGTGQITGARIFNNKVYLGISGTPDNDEEFALSCGGCGFTKKGGIISGAIATPSSSNSQETVIESWRERF